MSAVIGSQNADTLPAIPAQPADLTVELEPFSTNAMHRPGEWAEIRRSAAYAAWMRAAVLSVAYERRGAPVRGPYALRLRVPANRMDVGNLEKPISDALQAGQAIENDRLAECITTVRDRSRTARTVLAEVWNL